MSNYSNFVSDFPGRCAKLLKQFEKPARYSKLEVTHMLCVAMPSILVPLERLEGPHDKSLGHPSQDWKKYERPKSVLDDLYKQSFRGSALWPVDSLDSWCFGKLAEVTGDPDSWEELNVPKRLSRDKTVRSLLKHIRNALAHGNIFTRGRPEIEQIILLSKPDKYADKFNFLLVGPADFRAFLNHWLAFLQKLDLPVDVVSRCEEAAA